MNRELINRSIQNILDVENHQDFNQFNTSNLYDYLYHFFDNENYHQLIESNKEYIDKIENNSIELNEWNIFNENLKEYMRKERV